MALPPLATVTQRTSAAMILSTNGLLHSFLNQPFQVKHLEAFKTYSDKLLLPRRASLLHVLVLAVFEVFLGFRSPKLALLVQNEVFERISYKMRALTQI